jgi:hypothetical protein
VNDGPVNAVPGAQTVNEDSTLSIGGISVSDVDGNLATTQLSVTNGALNVSLAGGATISAGANGQRDPDLVGHAGANQRRAGEPVVPGQARTSTARHADGVVDRCQRCDGFGCGRDHGDLGQRRPAEHGAGARRP